MANVQSYHILKYARYFGENGHELTIITFEEPLPEFSDTSASIVRLNKPLFTLALPLAIIRLKRLVKSINPDVLHAHYLRKYGVLASLTGFRPLLVHAWGTDINTGLLKNPVYRNLIRLCFKRSQAIFSGTRMLSDKMKSVGAPAEKIHTIPWGVDTNVFKPENRSNIAGQLTGFKDNPLIISTRKFERVYDIPTVVKAIPHVLEKHPDARFILLGGGSQKQKVAGLLDELDVSDKAYVTDFLPNRMVPEIIASCDIYVQSSLTDGGLSISAKEAMASGLPVILSDIAVNKSIEGEGVGHLFKAGDSSILAEKISLILDDGKARERMGEKARQLVVNKYEYRKMLERQVEVYESLGAGAV